ncbi:DUF1788 domain-containing protein [Rhizobium leguminosarum]|uniref:DUF1788 domain-containing protein n=1 Tax=Rhizobium leguminosarum TaxID=384 RepID=UPI00103067BC|nr:DUF1788 domain-containing protein [Rhizobium leguminosarum]TAX55349.1 DUF1788 domain-containing protein [Rhizobium leguminosarum]
MSLKRRLDLIRDRVISREFVEGRGLGKEVPFYAFDYHASDEETVASYATWLVDDINRKNDISLVEVNLLDLIRTMLIGRGIFEKTISMEMSKGAKGLLSALKGPLESGKVADAVLSATHSADVLFLTGIGQAYPMVRAHSLLNNLQPRIGNTPVVMFFPGRFNGLSLQLFGDLQESSYYRAFKLVD